VPCQSFVDKISVIKIEKILTQGGGIFPPPIYIGDGHAVPLSFSEGGIILNKLTKYKLCGDIDATITGKLLYLILDELADGNGEVVIPQRKISDALHISKGTVSRNLRRLRDGGYINIHSTYHSDGGRAANKYRIR